MVKEAVLVVVKVKAYLVLHWILLCIKFEEFRQQFIQFVNENFINFSLIVQEKSLSIPIEKEENFDNNV